MRIPSPEIDEARREAQERREEAGRRALDAEEAVSEAPRREGRGDTERPESSTGYYLYGVNRAGAWRSSLGSKDREELLRIRYRDLEALVRPCAFSMPTFDRDAVQEHQRVIWNASKRDTLLPAPCGIVFRGRRAIIRFLQEQYIPLEEGIALVEGHWELRLHLKPTIPELRSEAAEGALHVYSELRRFARAAFPFPHEEEHVLSAAFLVNRGNWLQFMDQAEELGHRHTDLTFDVTGPWPPYDFVRISR
ncbi:MAG TPA: GvpL/GvpF family gas vesicle protein [Longimicrobiales bacterium]|nr:GvpL/GvpF family gas vesicle protein [Longimicrobiales bacterium]